ncbi:MAG: c-type cytochrome, partial [Planctomycetota bacterium]|nr:c-type cytochrome [Planctomycetota bacterium]
GDTEAIQRALQIIKNKEARIDTRRFMLRSLLNQQNAEASALLEALMDEPLLVQDAIRGYAVMENESAAEILMARYEKLTASQKRAVVETLSSRATYARQLMTAMADQRIVREDIPAHVARSLEELLGDKFTAVYGVVPSVAEDRVELLAKYKALVTPTALEGANASMGRAIFKKTCAACHTLYGEGGKVGPDLTGSNRANLDYILLNCVAPSFDVPVAYKTVRIITVNGRIVNGVLAEEDDARIVLKTAEVPRIVIAKEDIDERSVSPKSMMPDGQLDKLKEAEVLNLIKYLRTVKQVDLPK